MTFHAKTGIEIYTLDMDALLLNRFGSQQRIQSTRDKGNSFADHGIWAIKKGC